MPAKTDTFPLPSNGGVPAQDGHGDGLYNAEGAEGEAETAEP